MELAASRRSEREDQAHRMADAQWRVFPAEPGGKRPATVHDFLDGTTDHKAIERWWREDPRYNLAVATGAPGPDVLDVDNHGEKGNGFGAFNRLKQAGLVRSLWLSSAHHPAGSTLTIVAQIPEMVISLVSTWISGHRGAMLLARRRG